MRAAHCWKDHQGYTKHQMWQQCLLCCALFLYIKIKQKGDMLVTRGSGCSCPREDQMSMWERKKPFIEQVALSPEEGASVSLFSSLLQFSVLLHFRQQLRRRALHQNSGKGLWESSIAQSSLKYSPYQTPWEVFHRHSVWKDETNWLQWAVTSLSEL